MDLPGALRKNLARTRGRIPFGLILLPRAGKETTVPGLLRGVARTAVVAGTATAVSNRVSRRQQGRWAQQEAQPQYQEPPPAAEPAPAPAAPSDDMTSKIDQLKQLGDLKAQGVLTEAEFDEQKRRILG
jgi:hypothetical protein